MKPIHFSTHEVNKPHQLEAWRAWYDGSFGVTSRDAGSSGFAAESEIWRLNGVALVRVSAPPLRATRTRSMIRKDPTDHWVITIGRQATTGLVLQDDEISVPAGVPFVLFMGASFTSERDQDSRLQLNIARDKFSGIASTIDSVVGRTLNTPAGIMLAEYIQLLERQLPSLTDDDVQNLPQAIATMVAACIAPSADRISLARMQVAATLKDKARRIILKSLSLQQFGPDKLCRELGMSRSSVYRLFKAEGGLARYIHRLRLSESLAQLSDPSNRRPIIEIASELGMVDPSSFSRAFRREFGVCPSDAREAAQAGLAPTVAPTDQGPSVGMSGLLSRL